MKHTFTLAVLLFMASVAASWAAGAGALRLLGLTWDKAPSHDSNIVFRLYQTVEGETKLHEAGPATQITLTNITPGVQHRFVATAKDVRNGLESLPSDELLVDAPALVGVTQLTNVTVVRSIDKVVVQWERSPANQDVFLYELYWRTPLSPDFNTIETTNLTASFTPDRTLVYEVGVRAIGPAGAGPWAIRDVPALRTPDRVFVLRTNKWQYQWDR